MHCSALANKPSFSITALQVAPAEVNLRSSDSNVHFPVSVCQWSKPDNCSCSTETSQFDASRRSHDHQINQLVLFQTSCPFKTHSPEVQCHTTSSLASFNEAECKKVVASSISDSNAMSSIQQAYYKEGSHINSDLDSDSSFTSDGDRLIGIDCLDRSSELGCHMEITYERLADNIASNYSSSTVMSSTGQLSDTDTNTSLSVDTHPIDVRCASIGHLQFESHQSEDHSSNGAVDVHISEIGHCNKVVKEYSVCDKRLNVGSELVKSKSQLSSSAVCSQVEMRKTKSIISQDMFVYIVVMLAIVLNLSAHFASFVLMTLALLIIVLLIAVIVGL